MKKIVLIVLTVFLVISTTVITMAHGPVQRAAEIWESEARMFVADASNGDIVVVDLPDGKVVNRISTPPYIMNLGLTADQRHLFATRGRNTDRDYVTVINTAFDTTTGEARLPFVSRTFEGFSPGGAKKGSMTLIGDSTSMVNELKGELLTFDGDFDGLGAVDVKKYKLANPDHYHYIESDGLIYVGHLRSGIVQILNKETGEEVKRITGCPVLHGAAQDSESGRLFFGCSNSTLVVGTKGDEAGKEISRFAYPEDQRVAAFLEGKDRVFWGYTEGTLPVFYKLDAGKEEYSYEVIPVTPSIRQAVSDDLSYLLSLTRSGNIEIRDSVSGDLLSSIKLGKGWSDELHEHVDKAILPDIVTLGDFAFISLPDEARIAQVDMTKGKVVRYLNTGGEPTRIVILSHSNLSGYEPDKKDRSSVRNKNGFNN